MTGVPDSWLTTSIGEVTEYVSRGKSPKYAESSSLPVVNQKAIRWNGIHDEHLKCVHPDQFDSWSEERFIRAGDILWNSTGTGTVGRACLVSEKNLVPPKVVDSHVTIVRPNIAVTDPRYLFSWIKGPKVQGAIADLATGTTNQIELNRSTVLATEVPLAPIAEQKRIADKLEAVLARVDACRERLNRIPAILKRFRQSVLAAATSGKLTEEWRGRLPEKERIWESTTFGSVCQDITVGYVGKMSSEYRDKGIPFLRSLNVRPFRFDPTDLRFISPAFHRQIGKSSLKPRDVVVVRTGAPGQCCVIPDSLAEANCSDLVIVRPGPRLLSEYACIFINSETSQSFVRSEQVGVAQLHFNVGSMKVTPLLLPVIDEQKEIARRVEMLFSYADRIEARYAAARDQVERLTPSLLAKAFRGELVPQDPNDEPASVLLDRMRASKFAAMASEKRKLMSSVRGSGGDGKAVRMAK